MANKDRNKRSARQARARERAAIEAAQQASQSAAASDGKKSRGISITKGQSTKPERAAAKSEKPGFFGRVRNYFSDVRTEMRRVVWPSRAELKNYSVAVIVTLVVFGVAIWLVDSGFVALLVGFTGLRGA